MVVDLRRFEHALSNASKQALVLMTDHPQFSRFRLHHRSSEHTHTHAHTHTFTARF